MSFLRIKLLPLACLILFASSCGSKLPVAEENNGSNFPSRKAYVVLRSEGTPENLQHVKNILSSDFLDNNVSTNFSLYKAKQGWNQNQIFQTAYQGQFDYIVLIDQVAKFTIDGKTQIGGKYQLRSYHIKSPNPNWLDLGQTTCNVTVTPSIQKFSREVIRGIVGNQAKFVGHDFEYDETAMASTTNSETKDDEKNLTSEIERLKEELEAEKRKTQLAEAEKKRAENQLKLELEAQRQKTKLAQRSLREAEEALRNPPEVESGPKELTREERIIERQNAKRRLAEAREEARRKEVEAAAKRKEDRKRLSEAKREEQRRIREERVAQNRKAEALALKEVEDKRLLDQKRKAEKLAEARGLEEERLAEQQRKEEELRIEKEKASALAQAKEREAQRLAEVKRMEEKRQADELEAQRKEAERIAQLKLQEEQQRIAEKRKEAKKLAEQQRKALELAEAKRLEEKRKADALAMQQREAKRLAENKSKEKREPKEQKKKQSRKEKDVSPISTVKPVNALIIIRGKESDEKMFKDLKDHLEFDFMFAKAKAKTVIFNPEQSVSLSDVSSMINEDQNIAVLVDQREYLGDGESTYNIRVLNNQAEQDWNDIGEHAYNLSKRDGLKKLSQKVTNSINN